MVCSELRLAASLGLPVVVVVFCDGSLHRIEIKQAARRYPTYGTRIENPDIVKLAESMFCHGVRVETPAELRAALEPVRALDRPLVIEAHVDPTQYESQF